LRIFFCRFLSEYRTSLFLAWAVVPHLTIWIFQKNSDWRKTKVFDNTNPYTIRIEEMRTLPLVPVFKEKLLKLKEQQEEYKRVCGRCYNKKYLEYICVDEMGTLISPHYLTASFPKLLEKNNLRHIRFHDLRHSCASLLLANGVPMKQIQEWLGHSDFSTTANVYAHLDYNSKLSSADAMVNGLSGALEAIS
jgi:integrase